ncbi:hypothetical protein EGW08_015979 [Elysia chlorotica]|uniref:Uncharacterized protein n=1 Tax=Elysia chlorotica TaxID=188477 RepID=A0A433T409_ELYCH|nr:hypothetical protein EGW08_015979 [Elysia chlorotica]
MKTKDEPGQLYQALRCVLWGLFCTTEGEELRFGDAEQRWRTLLWALVVSVLWNSTRQKWEIFAPILLLTSFIQVSLMCARCRHRERPAHSCWQFPAFLTLLGAASAMTSSPAFTVLGRLTQKISTKEYLMWCHWCPDTHVTIMSVVVITCAVQGIIPWIWHSRSMASAPSPSPDRVVHPPPPGDAVDLVPLQAGKFKRLQPSGRKTTPKHRATPATDSEWAE